MSATAIAGRRACRRAAPPLPIPAPNEPRDGVLVLSGYGLRIAVERGHLMVEDGIADERRRARFSRLDRDLKRVVVLGHTGSVSLEAVRWLNGVGVPLIHLNSDGQVFFVAAPAGAVLPTLRRSQALAAETGLGIRLSVDLIAAKVEGQRQLLSRLPGGAEVQETLQRAVQAIRQATRLPDLRRMEAGAARVYWRAWQPLPVRFAPRDFERVPRHWRTFGTRASPLTGSQSPRKAVNPANAILNYLCAVLEAEARIAVLAAGLDPVLGLLHADVQCRDSLVFDVMEPVRPAVDAFLLDFLAHHKFTTSELIERLDGQCRLLPPLAEELAATAPLWARRVRPVAQQLATTLLAAEREQTGRARAARALSANSGRAPTGQRGRGMVVREYPARVEPDKDSRRAPAAGLKRRRTMAQVVAANRAWTGEPPDPEGFRGGVMPKLKHLKLAVLVRATGLTKSACSRIRAGGVVPHPRHWEALADLVS
jgi:CRISPR-associated endonuclease Cas1